MKKAVYKKIDERIEYITIHHEATVDEKAYDEVVKKVIPIMGVIYEDIPQEEVITEQIELEPTVEDRLEAIEAAILEMILGGF